MGGTTGGAAGAASRRLAATEAAVAEATPGGGGAPAGTASRRLAASEAAVQKPHPQAASAPGSPTASSPAGEADSVGLSDDSSMITMAESNASRMTSASAAIVRAMAAPSAGPIMPESTATARIKGAIPPGGMMLPALAEVVTEATIAAIGAEVAMALVATEAGARLNGDRSRAHTL